MSILHGSQYGVKPDVMTCAKALGCGVPVGAFRSRMRKTGSSHLWYREITAQLMAETRSPAQLSRKVFDTL